MAGIEEPARRMHVASSRIDLGDVSGRVLFPSPLQGPWLPFLRFAETTTIRGGDDPEGHTHLEEEALNYIVQGRIDYEDNVGHRSTLGPGMVELLTAREETRHMLKGLPGDSVTRWISLVAQLPRSLAGPSHRFQIAPAPSPIELGEAAACRLLVGPEAPVKSDGGLAVTDLEFRREGPCACPVGSERRAVAYVYDGSVTIDGQPVELGDGMLVANVPQITVRGTPGSRVMVASAPHRMT